MTTRVRVLIAAAALALVVSGGVVLWLTIQGSGGEMRASSQQSGHAAALAEPGVAGEWRPDGEAVGAWLQRTWEAPVAVRRVVLRSAGSPGPGIAAGFLRFSDGSQVHVRLTGLRTEVPLTLRQVTSMRFTITDLEAGGTPAGLVELDADAERTPGGAVETAAPSDGDVAGTADMGGTVAEPRNLVDGDPDTSTTVEGAVTLAWDQPRELSRVSIAGSGAGATIRSATLTFSDGSTLPFGAIVDDPTRPTTVAFMPRSTTSLRVAVDAVDGEGDVRLSSVAVFQRGAAPARPTGTNDPPVRLAPAPCAPPGERPSDETGVVVLCPTNGSPVDGAVTISVAAGPTYAAASATPWPSESREPAGETVRADLDSDGGATLDLDVSSLPVGPFTVAVQATGSGVASTVFLQLTRPGPPAVDTTRGAPSGRALVYDEEFDAPLSVNRTGDQADYAAGKPESGGVADFGDAIFADPALGLGNVTLGEGYLRLSVSPRTGSFLDPQGWGREHLGGMLASARPGGSGVSAQYGYFEARMLAPAAPGTWPAFWLLTTPNLVEPQRTVAEIDAIELYGHDPVSACHTSHQYPDPEEVGKALCGRRWDSERQALQWHTYGVDVRPDRIVYFVDGEEVADAPQVGAGDEPMFFMLDLALGGGWPVELSSVRDRADLYVDWVRVYV